MSDDWKPGDLALCVRDHACLGPVTGWEPKVGGVYTVAKYLSQVGGSGWLHLQEDPQRNSRLGAWEPLFFRKIHPLSIEERYAEIRLLTGKPVKEPAA